MTQLSSPQGLVGPVLPLDCMRTWSRAMIADNRMFGLQGVMVGCRHACLLCGIRSSLHARALACYRLVVSSRGCPSKAWRCINVGGEPATVHREPEYNH